MGERGDRTPARADARRNRERILDAAVEVLAEDRNASMAAIAERAGVSRATLYRHFATCDEMIAVTREEALARGREVLEQALTPFVREDGTVPAVEILEQLVWVAFSEDTRYRRLMAGDPHRADELLRSFRPVADAFIADAQRRGHLRSAVSPSTLRLAIESLVVGTMHGIVRGETAPEDAHAVVSVFLRSVAAPA